jgi:hypothetical protein
MYTVEPSRTVQRTVCMFSSIVITAVLVIGAQTARASLHDVMAASAVQQSATNVAHGRSAAASVSQEV